MVDKTDDAEKTPHKIHFQSHVFAFHVRR